MTITIGFIPYLNMVPFHQEFGPEDVAAGEERFHFKVASPHALGRDAEQDGIDAGAMSLVDSIRLSHRYDVLGDFGIGVKNAARSVLLFSKKPLPELEGMCAVTDETSTSVRLLQILLEKRYGRTSMTFARISASLYDGSADSLLLIGDEALRARRDGIKGLPLMTDLATEWFEWQKTPFVFARWMVRKDLPEPVKIALRGYLARSLENFRAASVLFAQKEAPIRGLSVDEITAYWDGFVFNLTPDHQQAIAHFREFVEPACLTA